MQAILTDTLIFYVVIGSFTPGPGNLLALNTTTKFGWKKSQNLIWGIGAGYITVQFLCTMIVYVFNASITPFLSVLKYFGALYICYLAYQVAKSTPEDENSSIYPTFKTGYLLQLVNPRGYVYVMTLITTYFLPHVSTLPELFFAGICSLAVGFSAALVWAFFGLKMQEVYKKNYKGINIILAVLLIYCAWGIITS